MIKKDFEIKDLDFGKNPDKGLNIFVKGENLTATRYSINDGFPMPKATFMGGIEVTF